MNSFLVWVVAVIACVLGAATGLVLRPHAGWVTRVTYSELTFSPTQRGCTTVYSGVDMQFGSLVAQGCGGGDMACDEETTLGSNVRVTCGCRSAAPDAGPPGKQDSPSAP